MNIIFSDLFSQFKPWINILSSIQGTPPVQPHQLKDLLDFVLTESQKQFPDPQVIAGVILLLEKSGFKAGDITDVKHLNALEVLTHKYGSFHLNPIRSDPDPVYLGAPPLQSSRVTGPMAGVV